MNLVLLTTVVMLFFIAFIVCDKDFFAPAVIVTLVFSICCYIALYANKTLDLNINKKTYSILVLGLGTIVAVNVLVKFFFMLQRKSTYKYLKSQIIEFRIYNKYFFVTLSAVVFVISIIAMLRLSLSIGGSGLSSIIYLYRMNSLSGDQHLPSIVSNLITINYALGYCWIYVCINNFYVSRKIDKSMILMIIFPVLTGILSGSRGDVIHYIIFAIALYYFYYLISKNKKTIDMKLVRKILIVFILLFLFFYLSKFVIGRQDELGYFEYICGHLAHPLKLLDKFVNDTPASKSYWGEETFTNMIATILKYSKSGEVLRYNTYASFVYINGISYGNVYTAFRAYYSDFGTLGVIVVPGCISLFSSVVYYGFRTRIFNSKRIFNWYIFIYSYLVYGLFMMFYSNQILEYIVNISFFKNIIVWVVFYTFCLRGVKLKIGEN